MKDRLNLILKAAIEAYVDTGEPVSSKLILARAGLTASSATVRNDLAELEREGKLRAVITQNIDGLHQDAGSKRVIELHGSTRRCYCARCRQSYPTETIEEGSGVPRCRCGGIIRPDVVLYEEGLDQDDLYAAVEYIRKADVLIVGGTSLIVYPAAGLISYYKGRKLVLINMSPTPRDDEADLIIRSPIGQVFSQL